MTPSRPSPDVLIIGGGIIGLATAWELARRQVAVEIVDAGEFAQAASAAAAGMLAPLFEAQGEDDFFSYCRQSRDLWETWSTELQGASDLDLDYDTSGAVALTAASDGDALATLMRCAAAVGEPCRPMDAVELREVIPHLRSNCGPGLLLPGEHRVDNQKVCRALLVACERAGVGLFAEHGVRAIERRGQGWSVRGDGWRKQADRVILAAGVWTTRIDGVPPLPLSAVRGQMFELADVEWPFIGSVRVGHHYAVRRRGQRLLVGATMEPVDGDGTYPTPAGLHELLDFSQRWFPGVGGLPMVRSWAGLRPATPDGRPLIGWLEDGLAVASGHFRNGILLAPWTGRQLTSALLGQVPMPEVFSPRRDGRQRRQKVVQSS